MSRLLSPFPMLDRMRPEHTGMQPRCAHYHHHHHHLGSQAEPSAVFAADVVVRHLLAAGAPLVLGGPADAVRVAVEKLETACVKKKDSISLELRRIPGPSAAACLAAACADPRLAVGDDPDQARGGLFP